MKAPADLLDRLRICTQIHQPEHKDELKYVARPNYEWVELVLQHAHRGMASPRRSCQSALITSLVAISTETVFGRWTIIRKLGQVKEMTSDIPLVSLSQGTIVGGCWIIIREIERGAYCTVLDNTTGEQAAMKTESSAAPPPNPVKGDDERHFFGVAEPRNTSGRMVDQHSTSANGRQAAMKTEPIAARPTLGKEEEIMRSGEACTIKVALSTFVSDLRVDSSAAPAHETAQAYAISWHTNVRIDLSHEQSDYCRAGHIETWFYTVVDMYTGKLLWSDITKERRHNICYFHRNIKLENTAIGHYVPNEHEHRRILLLDFGLAPKYTNRNDWCVEGSPGF
ncbi:hypothetical protein niasHS_001004 [Heterodera schachtii]|uniref:Protein kinase domain-containing protein n=1 Tax=Heterodera schachtii TaxID=97005 RepID=A0ABD2K804_HETSC